MEQTTEKDIQQVNGGTFQYWIPKPTLKGWRVWGLAFINLMTALGLCLLAILGFAFNQIDNSDFATLRWWLMLVGSVFIALGSEVGTLVTTVEIFRKQSMASRRPFLSRMLISILAIARSAQVVRGALSQIAQGGTERSFNQAIKMIDRTLERQEKGALLWDWFGLIISALTSLSAVALAYVSSLYIAGNVNYSWLPIVQQWSPVGLALFGVLDGYINHAEFGLFLASFDEQVKQWFSDREAARKEVERIERKNGKSNQAS
jgi:hypothetical protein